MKRRDGWNQDLRKKQDNLVTDWMWGIRKSRNQECPSVPDLRMRG